MTMMNMMNTQDTVMMAKNVNRTTGELLASKIDTVQKHAKSFDMRVFKAECALDELTKLDSGNEFKDSKERRAKTRARYLHVSTGDLD